tara:strand:- start:1471 stop:1629 length:159 start_codon:yes stop_codon:yes gene_type:complete
MEVKEQAELTGKLVVGGVKGSIMPVMYLVFFATAFQILFSIFQAIFTGNVYR